MSEQLTYPVAVISQLLGLSDRRIQQLANDGVIPKAERGRYPLIGSVKGYVNFLRSQLPNSGKPNADIRVESARLKKAQANLAEMEEAERRGLLLDAEVIYKQDYAVGRTIRDNLLTLPDRIASILAKKSSEHEIHKLLHAEIIDSINKVLSDFEKKAQEELKNLAKVKDETGNN